VRVATFAAGGVPSAVAGGYHPAATPGTGGLVRLGGTPLRNRFAAAVAVATLVLGLTASASVRAAVTPAVSAGDLAVTEPSGRNGSAPVELPIILDQAAAGPVSVAWRTVAGTAGTSDFVAASGIATIPAGAQGAGIPLSILADRTTEPTETFTVQLTSATGATIAGQNGLVTIRDASTGLAVADVSVIEPDAGTAEIGVGITVPSAPAKAVTFSWLLRSGTGTVGSDAVAASGTGTIAKGALSTTVRVRVVGDLAVEPDETVEIVVSAVKNVDLADGIGTITLRNDDVAAPTPTPTPLPTPTAKPTPTPSPIPTPTPVPTPTPLPSATPTPTPVPTPTPTPTATATPFESWEPPDGAIPATGTVIYAESSAGDWVGQGQTYRYTLADAVIGVTADANVLSLHIRGDELWDAQFAEDAGQTALTVGAWTGGRYPFFVPGLAWYGEGRSCNEVVGGRLIVDEVTYQSGSLKTLTLRFEQRCESASAPPLRGLVRYDRDDPTVPPPPGNAADFAWSPPAGAVPATGDYLYFESSSGDYIGQGRTSLYTADNATISATDPSGVVHLHLDEGQGWWDVYASGPDAQTQLLPGLYDDLQRYPFHNPTEGGLDMSGEGRGCNTLAGAFAVDSIAYDQGGLQSFSIRFVQRCEAFMPPLYGAMRWTRPGS
jgi:hypothetical protein